MKVTTGKLNNLENKIDADLVFYCFDRKCIQESDFNKIQSLFPTSDLVGFSTSGHYISNEIEDDNIVYAALKFESSSVKVQTYNISDFSNSGELGEGIAKNIEELSKVKGIGIISDGGQVNGTELMTGLSMNLDNKIPIFGGMAGDQARFEATMTGLNEMPSHGNVIVISFIGEKLNISTAHDDGWSSMGMEFTITSSEGNILNTADNKNIYDMLHELLEPENEDEFNRNTLFYPFSLTTDDGVSVIRTPIKVNHKEKTLVYAGDMPQGAKITLMKSNTMDLLDSAMHATTATKNEDKLESFLFAISCVGRRVVLGDMASEEYEEISNIYDKAKILGFYSYGEFTRSAGDDSYCKMHNQTFTLASISEGK